MSAEAAPLRIQLVTKPGSPATGIGRYAHEVARGLPRLGVEVRVAELETPIPGPIAALAHRAGYDLAAFSRSYPLRADVRRGYVTHLTSQTLATLLLTQRLPRPVVVTVHDILPYLLRDDPELCVYRTRADRAMDALAMRGLRRADRLIAVSAYTKQTVVDALGIPAGRIDVVHLGVDTQTFRPQPVPEAFRERYGLPADKRYVLHVGSDDPRKDIPTLLRAFALAREREPDIELVRVGAPAFADERRRNLMLADELGIAGAVRWVEGVPEGDLPLFYNAASVFAFPSRYEGFGLPVLEALACGTPVVAADTSSIPELVGLAAALVRPADHGALATGVLNEIATSPAQIDERIRQASAFTWDLTLRQTQTGLTAALLGSRRVESE